MPRVGGPAAERSLWQRWCDGPGRRCCCMMPIMALSITLGSPGALHPVR